MMQRWSLRSCTRDPSSRSHRKSVSGLDCCVSDSPLLLELRATRDKVQAAIDSLNGLLDTLNRRMESLLEKETHSQEVDARMDQNAYLRNDILRLNLRGTVFDVPRDLILKYPGSYLDVMISSDRPCTNELGEYFIDRSPYCFETILRCMHEERLLLDGLEDDDLILFEEHLDYLQLPIKHKMCENYHSTSIQAHETSVLTLMQMQDGRICSGSADGLIKVWNNRFKVCEAEMRGHRGAITKVIQLIDHQLCSCSRDHTIKLWDPHSYACLRTLEGHTSAVKTVIQLGDYRLCSASNDKLIFIWEPEGGLQHVLDGHKGAVQQLLDASGGTIVSSSADKTLRVWSLDSLSSHRSVSMRERAVSIHLTSSNRVLALLFDASMVVVNLSTGEIISILSNHSGWIHCALLLSDGTFCSAGFSGKINIWDLKYNTKKLTLSGHETEIRAICELGDGRLVSGSEDGTIRVWS